MKINLDNEQISGIEDLLKHHITRIAFPGILTLYREEDDTITMIIHKYSNIREP